MPLPPVIARRDLDGNLRKALDLMLEALFLLDCAGERGAAISLSEAVDYLVDAPRSNELTHAQRMELDDRIKAYNLAVAAARKNGFTA